MNYAERCRQIAGEMRATVEVLGVSELASSADRQIAALLESAAELWEAESEIQKVDSFDSGCLAFADIESAMEACDAAAKGAE